MKLFKSKDFYSVALAVILSLTVVAISVSATTTISTSISTGGALDVTGLATLTGGFISQASSTVSGTLTAAGYLGASSTAGFTGLASFYGGFISSASSTVSSTLKVDALGVASSSPYVALGVTGTTTSSAGAVIGAGGSGVTQLLFGTCSVGPGVSVTASTTYVTTCVATGVSVNDKVFLTPADLANQVIFTGASSTAANTIQVGIYNGTGAAVSPATTTWAWTAIK